MRRLIFLTGLLPALVVPAHAQAPTPEPKRMVIETTDQELQGILSAGTKCLERDAWACAEMMVYVRANLVAKARPVETKPELGPGPSPAPSPKSEKK